MKNNQNEIIVPFSIFKHILLLLGSVAFAVGGFSMFHAEPTRKYPEWSLKFWGMAAMLLFGLASLYYFIMLFKGNKGVIISEEGILDNSTIVSLGLIKWEDIQKITTTQSFDVKYIYIVLKPEKEDFYIKKVKNPILRKIIEFNMKRYGYIITALMLKIKTDELVKLMRAGLRDYKERQREISKKE